ncbi:MAG: hypothetical protein ABI162_08215 [Luteolibacter sp.]
MPQADKKIGKENETNRNIDTPKKFLGRRLKVANYFNGQRSDHVNREDQGDDLQPGKAFAPFRRCVVGLHCEGCGDLGLMME